MVIDLKGGMGKKRNTKSSIFVTETTNITNKFSLESYLIDNQSLENSINNKSRNSNLVNNLK